jgi:activator of HSP90 ATPase
VCNRWHDKKGIEAGVAGAAASLGTAAAQGAVTIHEELDLHVSPRRIYEALLDAKKFSDFSGAFSLFGGQISGRNVELVADRRIVQAWRAGSWPEGVYSIARFELTTQGFGARLVFDHSGFPPKERKHLAGGRQEHYFGPLKKYFGE